MLINWSDSKSRLDTAGVGLNALLQWNINSIKTKFPKLEHLLNKENVGIVALQETKNPTNKLIKIRGYNVYQKDRNIRGGGVLLAVHNSIPSSPIIINTNLEIVACTVYFRNQKLNICNFYLPDHAQIVYNIITNLIDFIPEPRIILGDFNAKHPLWGSPDTDPRGILLSDCFMDKDLFVMNDGSPTRYDKRLDTYSHIDITCCSLSIGDKFLWSVKDTTYTSDHFPIILKYEFNPCYRNKTAKYKLKEANWTGFTNNIILPNVFTNANNDCNKIIESFISAANQYIPKTSTVVNPRYNVIWWRESCDVALANARRQFRILKRNHTVENIVEYNRLEAIATKEVNDAKNSCWISFLSKVNMSTSLTEVWGVVKALSGKFGTQRKNVLFNNNGNCSDPLELSNIFGSYFAQVSSSNNYEAEFLEYKTRVERNVISFLPSNGEYYNSTFTIHELNHAMKHTGSTSPGADVVHYDMIEKLSKDQKLNLLNFYNYLWHNNLFPSQWSEAIVLPFSKPGKPKQLASSYRPISLTSCLCKTMERMVLPRLTLVLEEHNFIKNYQSGFKRLNSTIDCLVRLESAIQDTFVNNKFMIAVFLDIEKAYDMLWRYSILRAMDDLGLTGNLPNFIINFLSNRSIRVKVGDQLSDAYIIENGIPQGSVLSCLLFSMIINSIFDKAVDIVKSLFCDDGLFWATGNTITETKNKIQRALDCLTKWSKETGFKFSINKSFYVIFTRKTKFQEPVLFLCGRPIERKLSAKYLGITFDSKLTWGLHIDDLVERCKQPMTLLKMVARRQWGGDRKTLTLMYKQLIRSKIDYGSFLYSTAKNCHLSKLNRIQYEAIRVIAGLMRTIPSNKSLEAEAHILPLEFRREQLMLNYFSNVLRLRNHPVTLFFYEFIDFYIYSIRPYQRPVIGRAKMLMQEANLPVDNLESVSVKDIYLIGKPVVRYNLLHKKSVHRYE